MHRLQLSRHTLPAVLAVAVSLLAPLLAGGGAASATAGSAVARAAVAEDIVPVQAPSARFAVGGPAMTAARQIAEAHWGTAPCKGDVVIAWVELDGDTNATAAWRNPTDAWNNAAENFDCHVEFNAGSDYDWPKLCTVMTHELGHLVGNPHADQGGQLMSPVYSEPLPACTGPEPGAPAAAASASASAGDAASATEPVVALRSVAPKKARTKPTRRCTRRFRAGRRALRCARPPHKTKRAARLRAAR